MRTGPQNKINNIKLIQEKSIKIIKKLFIVMKQKKHIKPILFVFLFISHFSFAQSENKLIKTLKKDIYFLADDKLEGRRTGTEGERLAYEYISKRLKKTGIQPFAEDGGYIQPFEINEGLALSNKTSFSIDGKTLELNAEFFPFAYSKSGTKVITATRNNIVLYDLAGLMEENKDNPHFDLNESLYRQLKKLCEADSQKTIFVHNSSATKDSLYFDEKNKRDNLSSIIIYINESVVKQLESYSENKVSINVDIYTKKRTGHNLVGRIDNKAEQTIILGAHYDHLGYGEDHNSLYVGKEPMIHNGADDNASGSAALLSLTEIIRNSGNKKFNYVFVFFSGEELGLYGSKYFTEHSPVDLKTVNYMVNMDMVGRLNDSTHGLTIGGFGTSPQWGNIIDVNNSYFKIKVDSAGSGPSDHTSFYRKDLPVLFFFTGTHSDYHKPSDDADKINYTGELKIIRYIKDIVDKTASMEKLVFSKTKEPASMGKSSFKVTMGIMPDYTFSGNGVLVDGVSDNRPAMKAGVKTGDVIYQLGDYMVSDVQTYMQALNKFSKGDTTTVKIKRGSEDIQLSVTF